MSAARPPPTRPHIGLHPSPAPFSTFSITEWGDEDAWDSASDEDSPSAQKPKRIPHARPHRTSSTSSISYSFIQAPDPSSYPPRPTLAIPEREKSSSGWTVIRSSVEAAPPDADRDPVNSKKNLGFDAEPDMVVGDMDPEFSTTSGLTLKDLPPPSLKQGPSKASVLPDIEKIVADPLHTLHRFHVHSTSPLSPKPPTDSMPGRESRTKASLMRERSLRTNRRHKFIECLTQIDVNIADLRKFAWSGIPAVLRPIAWPLLLGYIPLPSSMRTSTLARKRSEYQSLVDITFAKGRDGLDRTIWHQIEKDVPRTRPGVPLWMCAETQKCLERILYVWAIRHPASGYVQGINDLVTPFFQVFLSAYIDSDPEQFDPSILPKIALNAIEADSFWCLSRLLDGIQDNYIFAQPGIHRSVRRMQELVARIDPQLAAHLKGENVEFMQFAFRWMNCLLMREISVNNTIRMWDTYLAEGPDAFSQFHLYVCSAFLVKWTDKLREMDFQSIIMFLQSLPTQDWTDHDIELLLSEAFLLNSVWHHAQSHFADK